MFTTTSLCMEKSWKKRSSVSKIFSLGRLQIHRLPVIVQVFDRWLCIRTACSSNWAHKNYKNVDLLLVLRCFLKRPRNVFLCLLQGKLCRRKLNKILLNFIKFLWNCHKLALTSRSSSAFKKSVLAFQATDFSLFRSSVNDMTVTSFSALSNAKVKIFCASLQSMLPTVDSVNKISCNLFTPLIDGHLRRLEFFRMLTVT